MAQKKDAKAVALGRSRVAGDPSLEAPLAALEAAGLGDQDVRAIGKTLREALVAVNRFGTPDWDARLRAVVILKDLRGLGAKASESGGSGRVTVQVNLPAWAATGPSASSTPRPLVLDVTPRLEPAPGAGSAAQPRALVGDPT